MTIPAGIYELVLRYFGDGALPDFSKTLEILRRDPYRRVREDLARTWDVSEITDYNSDLAQVYALTDHPERLTVRLSMVGPYAMIARPTGELVNPDMIADLLRGNGFYLLPRETLELPVTIWSPEAEGSLYEFLFEFDQGLPWDS